LDPKGWSRKRKWRDRQPGCFFHADAKQST
jgi:hypothetical protein